MCSSAYQLQMPSALNGNIHPAEDMMLMITSLLKQQGGMIVRQNVKMDSLENVFAGPAPLPE